MNNEINHRKAEGEVTYCKQMIGLAISHWDQDDWKGLDERALLITIPIEKVSEAAEIMPIVHRQIRKSFGFKDKKSEIAMVAAADIKGTRNHSVKYETDLAPHIHAMAFLPRAMSPGTTSEWSELEINIGESIEDLMEIRHITTSQSRRVDVRRMEFVKSSIFNSLDYLNKAPKNYTHEMEGSPAHYIYPFEKYKKGKKDYLARESLKLRCLLHLYPEKFFSFSKNYLQLPSESEFRSNHEAATSKEEKAQILAKWERKIG